MTANLLRIIPAFGIIALHAGDFIPPANTLPERRTPLNPRAFIFDLDGVLANTEPLAFKAWQQLVDPTGVVMDDADYQTMLGMDALSTAQFIFNRTGLAVAPDEMVADHWGRVIALIDAELEAIPEACALVTELHRRGCRLAVASNSPTKYVFHVLKKIGLLDVFDAIVGRDQVQNGKPDPDPYLEAARLIGCDPADCVAVEDSPLGLLSAISAGMRCLAITPDGGCQNGHSQAFACFPSLGELYAGIDVVFDG
jgi:HAD superfamily hydrolase (TIGR01509 family)